MSLSILALGACDPVENSKAESLAAQKDTLKTATEPEIDFNADKAEAYGADEYGMKTYVMAFLKTGPNRPSDSAHSTELMRAHLDNISRLAKQGKLILAGPFHGDQNLRGIYIFDTNNIDSARAMTESDPAIQYGSLEIDLMKWYGSAALMEVNEIHKTIAKSEI